MITIASNNSDELRLKLLVWLWLHWLIFYLVIWFIAQKYQSWYGDISFFRVVRRIASGNLDVINFYFASLNGEQIVSLKMIFQLKRHIVMYGGFILWHNVPACCSGFKYFIQTGLGEKFPIFCSDHCWSRKYINIHYHFLTCKHFIMFSLRTTLMCSHNFITDSSCQ